MTTVCVKLLNSVIYCTCQHSNLLLFNVVFHRKRFDLLTAANLTLPASDHTTPINGQLDMTASRHIQKT